MPQMNSFKLSVVVPVYNRPEELTALLSTLVDQTCAVDEVVVVEDGSVRDSSEVITQFAGQLPLVYLTKPNTGPGDSRNFGMRHATGDYFIILDSDCELPTGYIESIHQSLALHPVDFFGGPDAAADEFSDMQKAISFSMTSFVTTGGVRGGRSKKFEPRSFNMGLSKKAFQASGGYGLIHPGEDPDLSIRLHQMGFVSTLFEQVFVYHKRRITWSSFYKQVYKFGSARPILMRWYPHTFRVTYALPSIFLLGSMISLVTVLFGWYLPVGLLGLYFLAILLVSGVQYKNMGISVLSLMAVIVQLYGYGWGFVRSYFKLLNKRKTAEELLPELFFRK
jgi:glycosyltransferase involved in cell wall biosynthesis